MVQNDAVALVARILLAAMFVMGGIGKITGYAGAAAYMASKGLPFIPVLLPATILVELGAGVLLVLGLRARIAALLLAAFTIAASVIFHDFWNLAGAARGAQQVLFMKNLAVLGGLLLLARHGPGRFSLDRR